MAGRQAGSSGPSEPSSSPRVSPPKVVVDDSPLQPAMGKHKESLKVKLMMRRPINQLVAQGIMPPLKTPPAYFEQCKQLERAKTGDLLKAKIQRRPDRQELERRHILEQESHVDPSLAEKQRMLKKARLADQLNDQLSHRPGPLELIKKNILHTEEDIETAVKSGTLAFKATSEGASGRPPHPSSYCGPPDESPSPSPPARDTPSLQHPAPGKDKNRKKAKQKHQPKARFKFHEYKGPPSAQKASSPPGSVETPYELLLQQQQLLLQLMLPASPAPSSAASVASDSSEYAPPPPPPPPPGVAREASRFEDMKVSDLRAECKRRNLRVSGPKPQLLDRLRLFLLEKQEEAPRSPASVASVASVASGASSGTGDTYRRLEPAEDIVVSQRRQISELERKLEASRRQLEAVRREAAGAAASDQSRRLLQAHLCVSQLRAQLDALQASPRLLLADPPDRLVRLYVPPDPPADARAHLLLNGVKVVPIAILPPARLEPERAPPPPPPPPPPLSPLPPADHDNSQIMDDVLEILVQNGELPPSAVGDAPAAPVGYPPSVEAANATFAPPDVLSDEVLGGPHAQDSLAAAELQRELDDIQNEILIHADMHAADAPDRSALGPPAEIDADLTVDFLSDGDFHADFGSDPNSADDDDFFGSLLSGDRGDRATERSQTAMDVVEEAPEPERTGGTSLTDGELLEEARTGFEYMDELSLPSFDSDERACDADMRAWGGDTRMCVDGDAYELLGAELLNQFGRGHAAPRDPLLAAVLPRAPPRPADKLYSWDRIEYDAS